MHDFTDNEKQMLNAFYNTSMEICGSCSEDENLSYMNVDDLLKVLGGTKQSIGGTISSLLEKEAISDLSNAFCSDQINDLHLFGTNVYEEQL